MLRLRGRLYLMLLSTSILLTLLLYSVGLAAPLGQGAPVAADGQEYVVQPGDTLYKISGEFYGEPTSYPRIVDATNAKAAADARFTPITNPRLIRVGQLLWIPTGAEPPIPAPVPTATAMPTAAPASAPTAVMSDGMGGGEVITPAVRFVTPVDGATVSPTFDVEMAATGLTIEPAGEIHEGAGHFHILIDTDFVAPGELVPFDDHHVHFGGGQLTTTLELEPGVHVLRLQVANGAHIALDGPQYRDTITVTVAGAQVVTPAVRFVTPVDGAVVSPTFAVVMAATGLTIEPAGEIHEGAGHFHILIDTDFVAPGELVPFDDHHVHFGGGQLTTTLELEPGVHVLRLQVANGAHIALDGPQYRDTITVTVAGDAQGSLPDVRPVAAKVGGT